uniref:RNase H type-1 domain-containing protein n=1 Tax=Cannabis sativa TaxID=3483 RepID=A0A803Q450_CANSA
MPGKCKIKLHGYGAIVQDYSGRVIVGFSSSAASGLSTLFAEAEAMLRALNWCKEVQFPIDLIVSDIQVLTSKILKGFFKLSEIRFGKSSPLYLIFLKLQSNSTPQDIILLLMTLLRRLWEVGTDKEVLWNNCVSLFLALCNCVSFLCC